jgi:hypothetical protein
VNLHSVLLTCATPRSSGFPLVPQFTITPSQNHRRVWGMQYITNEIPVDFGDGTWNDVADPHDPYAHIFEEEDDGEYLVVVRDREVRTTTYRVGKHVRFVTHQVITH